MKIILDEHENWNLSRAAVVAGTTEKDLRRQLTEIYTQDFSRTVDELAKFLKQVKENESDDR